MAPLANLQAFNAGPPGWAALGSTLNGAEWEGDPWFRCLRDLVDYRYCEHLKSHPIRISSQPDIPTTIADLPMADRPRPPRQPRP